MDNLARVDLNLLVTLEALLTEQNVTRAARRLSLSQPSVSVQLRKLRELFNDPLLTPVPGGMSPTAYGQALLGPLRAALDGARTVLRQPPRFVPADSTVTWQIAAADYGEYAVLTPLIAYLREHAPGVRLAVRQVSHSLMIQQLERGTIDLGLLALEALPEGLHSQVLYRECYRLVARSDHPALKRRLTIDSFSKLDFVLVSPDGGGFRGPTDMALESVGRKRRVVLSVPHFLFVPEVVARTDLVAMLPSRLIEHRMDSLRAIAPPLPIAGYDMAMIWHERSHRDPAHAWLREKTLALFPVRRPV
jgi:DNA-binding transcriptional LysR family regulator